MRKSKYDLFILYDQKQNKLIEMLWDTATNGVSEWRHRDGDKTWVVRDNKYLSIALRKYQVIDRVPEYIHRA